MGSSCRWPGPSRPAVGAAGARFIVNDRADLALAAEADGVHVGQDDLPPTPARRLLRPGNDPRRVPPRRGQARQALARRGRLHRRRSMFARRQQDRLPARRPRTAPAGAPPDLRPLVAIGGITEANVGEVIRAGADAVAVNLRRSARPRSCGRQRAFMRPLPGAADDGRPVRRGKTVISCRL